MWKKWQDFTGKDKKLLQKYSWDQGSTRIFLVSLYIFVIRQASRSNTRNIQGDE